MSLKHDLILSDKNTPNLGQKREDVKLLLDWQPEDAIDFSLLNGIFSPPTTEPDHSDTHSKYPTATLESSLFNGFANPADKTVDDQDTTVAIKNKPSARVVRQLLTKV